ncbi:glycosyltransferase family 2 protein [Aquabacterium sp.]|uniref:glycosyltransferase family 2 protein n=1 Tax=Aquabacterium sp. TaxID=1872578 RepID=UPI003D6D3627
MSNYFSKLFLALKMANYQRLRKRREPQRAAYRQWVAENDTIDADKLRALEASCEQLTRRPRISVIMPVYNAPLQWLDEAIESVRQQVYQDWELCIADDCSSDPRVRPFLQKKAAEDARIKLTLRPVNGHISAASNSAIEQATGEFLAFMDQDDLIPRHALLEVALCINHHPQAQFIYTDEDKIDEHSQRESPTRKTGWSPGLLTQLNKVSHLVVYRQELVASVGGLRVGFEGAQDHDLALRCSEQLDATQIIHIPKILYHWRSHSNSTAQVRSSKPYAVLARRKAIQEHLVRQAQCPGQSRPAS